MSPQFQSVADFLAMGGHAFFVWAAWGLSAATILALAVRAGLAQAHWRARMEAAERARADATPAPARGEGAGA
jgi:heme exporter protein D